MKMMQGAFFLPCSKRSRTREAPTPTNISTKSDPEMEKKGTLASPAMARASKVLPVPGGPTSSTPLDAAAELLKFLGLPQKLNNLVQFFLGLVHTGNVFEGYLLLLARKQPGAALAERERLVAATLHLTHEEDPETEQNDHRKPVAHPCHPRATRTVFNLGADTLIEKRLVEVGVVGRHSTLEGPVVGFQVAGNLGAGDNHITHVCFVLVH